MIDRKVAQILLNAAIEALGDGDDQAAIRAIRAELAKASLEADRAPWIRNAIHEAEILLDEHLEIGERIERRRRGEL